MKKARTLKLESFVRVIIIILILIKILYIERDDVLDFCRKNYYIMEMFTIDKVSWKEVDLKSGIYLMSSKDCPYCTKYFKNSKRFLTDLERKEGIKSVLVEIDIEEYFNDTEFEKFANSIALDTIPSIVVCDKGYCKIYGTKDIIDYNN